MIRRIQRIQLDIYLLIGNKLGYKEMYECKEERIALYLLLFNYSSKKKIPKDTKIEILFGVKSDRKF